jgi:hypothetical protein
MVALLRSASFAFPLVTIHRESADPDVCHIGRVVSVTDKALTLHEVTPGATWDDGMSVYKLREITRVDVGGGYEEALARVARVGEGDRTESR